jgi:hypothetical protein
MDKQTKDDLNSGFVDARRMQTDAQYAYDMRMRSGVPVHQRTAYNGTLAGPGGGARPAPSEPLRWDEIRDNWRKILWGIAAALYGLLAVQGGCCS